MIMIVDDDDDDGQFQPEEGVMLNGTFPKLFATLLGTQPDIRFKISFQFH